ncbi:hypothetical protein BCV70DRAFT_33118 [Testicularia cyperi]|uniref:Uncharacterized protein n=1 Tax=Testicularia cyperi TaxID=1882483 RepID=A0A317XMF8_9BASI|nr:hypothetical protein BCV70DRAFT_33118 [Testicularia cyperi]
MTLLYCTRLYRPVPYCTVLYCTVLYCAVLCCTVLYCTVFPWTLSDCLTVATIQPPTRLDNPRTTVIFYIYIYIISLPFETRRCMVQQAFELGDKQIQPCTLDHR